MRKRSENAPETIGTWSGNDRKIVRKRSENGPGTIGKLSGNDRKMIPQPASQATNQPTSRSINQQNKQKHKTNNPRTIKCAAQTPQNAQPEITKNAGKEKRKYK